MLSIILGEDAPSFKNMPSRLEVIESLRLAKKLFRSKRLLWQSLTKSKLLRKIIIGIEVRFEWFENECLQLTEFPCRSHPPC